ncbi:ribonucleoprotein, putative [Talaromyces stipitatus ATCC 10500]|uniref:Ribonucleoprotein, putative n=1 Tax=Talaromyces stipitatus (strain ATCC 10500 / CBS 375.48 / QM 6759 / NRRL 1006) TaxID=441959 RepID=B8MIQ4_TALSN|nr:ribonucleoprotein, putative [Talaromyces stipitatus ATCC 10500]EED15566.1 ribonucleoprotein, putative [Talaromyces stipitatus ATCC 10500]
MADTSEQTNEQQPWTPTKQSNGVRTTGRAFNSANWRVKSDDSPSTNSPRFNHQSGSNSPRSPFHNKSWQPVPQSITEGRRLYVGNMPYTAKREDVESIFEAGEYSIERIDISIDPFTGRNPSYCFVELATKEQADRAMVELDGKDLQGRPVRIKPGVAKSAQDRSSSTRSPQNSPSRLNDNTGSPSTLVDRWQRRDTSSSNNTKGNDIENSRRLYVGGLPKIMDKQALDADIQGFFKGYNLEAISKLITPHPSKRFEPGDHYYLFVDFATIEDAAAAQTALDGQNGPWGGKLRLGRARGESTKMISDRQKLASQNEVPETATVSA